MNTKRPKHILVIDDSSENLVLLQILLTQFGYKFSCAKDGREAISTLDEMDVLPDLILLDANMPIMDGYEFRSEQKKKKRLSAIPVLIMSGDHDPKMYEDMLQPAGFLQKPIQIKHVEKKLGELFHPRSASVGSGRHLPLLTLRH